MNETHTVEIEINAVPYDALNESPEPETPETETDENIVTLVEHTPIVPTVDMVTAYEPDPFKKLELAAYFNTLSDDNKTALYEGLKLSNGGCEPVANILAETDKVIELAKASQMTYLKNQAAYSQLQHFANLAAQLDRMVNGVNRDDSVTALKVKTTYDQIKELNGQLTALSTAIYSMAGNIGIRTPLEPQDLPIDIRQLVNIAVTVGHGVKTWAAAYKHGEERETSRKAEIATILAREASARKELEDYRTTVERVAAEERSRLLRSSSTFYVMNASGNYVGCRTRTTAEGTYRLTKLNMVITQDVSEAMEFPTIEAARAVLDTVQEWNMSFRSVEEKFRVAGVNPDTLFIGKVSIQKVEG